MHLFKVKLKYYGFTYYCDIGVNVPSDVKECERYKINHNKKVRRNEGILKNE